MKKIIILFLISLNCFSQGNGIVFSPSSASGTVNFLSKFITTSKLGNSLFFDDGTNTGIGNTSSGVRFQVAGTTSDMSTYSFVSSNNLLQELFSVRDDGIIFTEGYEINNYAISSAFPTLIFGNDYTNSLQINEGNTQSTKLAGSSNVSLLSNNYNFLINANGAGNFISYNFSDATFKSGIDGGGVNNFLINHSGVGNRNRLGVNNSAPAYNIDVNGDIGIEIGYKVRYATGTNSTFGSGTMATGTSTITSTAIQSTDLVIVTPTSSVLGTYYVTVSGGSFIIRSSNALDAFTYTWALIGKY